MKKIIYGVKFIWISIGNLDPTIIFVILEWLLLVYWSRSISLVFLRGSPLDRVNHLGIPTAIVMKIIQCNSVASSCAQPVQRISDFSVGSLAFFTRSIFHSPWRFPCRRGTRVIISTPFIPVHVTFAHRVTNCTGSTDKERRLSRSTRNP